MTDHGAPEVRCHADAVDEGFGEAWSRYLLMSLVHDLAGLSAEADPDLAASLIGLWRRADADATAEALAAVVRAQHARAALAAKRSSVELREAAAEIARLQSQVGTEMQQCDQFRARLAWAQEQLDGVLTSKSWRITAPLRRIGRSRTPGQ